MPVRLVAALLVLTASALVLGQDTRGTIRGRVELSRPAAAPRRPGVGDLGGGLARTYVQPPQAVVYLERPPSDGTAGVRPQRAVLDQRDETFVPHVLAITVGSIVDFPNNDRTFHNVFSLSRVRRFDLGRYGAGQSQSVRFDQPGIVRVFCDIHSHMNAFIHVFSHPYFAVTDAEGRYRIDGVPPGRHTVAAWHEGDRTSEDAVVPASGGTELNFAFR